MLKNKIFCFDEKKLVFVMKIGCQIKFCAYVIYKWYLEKSFPGFSDPAQKILPT